MTRYQTMKKAYCLKCKIDAMQAELAQLTAELIADIENSDDKNTVFGDVKCKYVAPSKPGLTLDSKMVKEKYPEIFEECQKATAPKKAYIRW